MTRLAIVLLMVTAVFAACSDDDDNTTTTPSPTIAATASAQLKPADSAQPASGVCPGPSTADPATVTFEVSVPAPRCLKVLPSAHLEFVNGLDRAVDVRLGSFSGTLQPGGTAVSEKAAGEFLAPGVHIIMSTAYGDGTSLVGSGEIWLVDE